MSGRTLRRSHLNLHDPDMLYQLQAPAAGFEILTRAVTPAAEDSSLAERAKELIQSSYHQKELNAEHALVSGISPPRPKQG